MAPSTSDIAIIGAGLAGLGLALCLQQQNIKCTVYESAVDANRFSGAIMLAPNALGILDKLGVYDVIKEKGFSFESAEFKTADGKTTGKYWFGNEKVFGYKGLRIYRGLLVRTLLQVAQNKGVDVRFGKKFEKIVKEDDGSGVEFKFHDGEVKTASLLVGADGIHSKVRHYVAPGKEPVYQGAAAVVGAVKRCKMVIPPGEPVAGPLMYMGKGGMFIVAPQDVDGSELMAGTQRRMPEMDRQGWIAFQDDKRALKEFLQQESEGWPEIVTTAIDGIDMDTVYVWPQYMLPRLDSWFSENQRVVLVGDACHAIPPTTGNGGNQAFEDAWALALLMAKISANIRFSDALSFWQEMRQRRVDKLIDLTTKINNARLPAAAQAQLPPDQIFRDEDAGRGEGKQMEWLFVPHIEEEIQDWIRTH